MPITIQTNISSLRTQTALAKSSAKLSASFERLSTGLRINKASDDAAGLSIASRLSSDSRIFTQSLRNINDGIGVANIAEGAIDSMKNIVLRIRELATQSASGNYSTKQRGALDKESQQLIKEFNRIRDTASFNDQKIFRPNQSGLDLQIGLSGSDSLRLLFASAMEVYGGTGTYSARQTLAAPDSGITSYSPELVDLNNDGYLDMVATGSVSGAIGVYLNNGDGTFRAGVSMTGVGFASMGIAAGDFNGDGNADIAHVAFNGGFYELVRYFGNGNGTFGARATQVLNVSNPVELKPFNANNDGNTDLLVIGISNQYGILLGNGNGTFQLNQTFDVGGIGTASSFGDLNGDGFEDLITVNDVGPSVRVFLNDGAGTFTQTASFAHLGGQDTLYGIGDLNNDSIADFVVGSQIANSTQIYLGNGNGTFALGVSMAGLGQFGPLTDINGDGDLDLFGSVQSRFGNGDGTFGAAFIHSGELGGLSAPAFGDLNNDGIIDAVDYYQGGVDQIRWVLGRGATQSVAAKVNTLQQIDISNRTGALAALKQLDDTRNRLSAVGAAVGASVSRLDSAIRVNQSMRDEYFTANSRIIDADVAEEAAGLARQQILQQAGVAVLAQANNQPTLALRLLGGAR